MSVSCDDSNLASGVGLLPAAVPAKKIGLVELIEQGVRLAAHGANIGTKAPTVIGSMLLGGDPVADTALLQAGTTSELSWPGCRAGRPDRPADLRSGLHGLPRLRPHQAGHRGSATPRSAATTGSGHAARDRGQVIFSRPHGGPAGAARGATSFLTETVSRLRHAGATGPLTVRADSAFYSGAMLTTARKFDVRFSITAWQDTKIRAATAAIPEFEWVPIPYWLYTPEVSGADVAETRAITVRLVVRRVLPTPGSQLRLFTDWDIHTVVTDRDGVLLEVGADHRRQSIAELKSAGVDAAALGATVGALAGTGRATAATLRRRLFTIPGRQVHTARRPPARPRPR